MGRLRLRLLGILKGIDMNAVSDWLSRFATPVVRWVALLGLCAAYLQGGIVKLANFQRSPRRDESLRCLAGDALCDRRDCLELVASVAILTDTGAGSARLRWVRSPSPRRLWPIDTGSWAGGAIRDRECFLRASGTRRRLPSGLRGTTYVIEHIESLPHES